MNQFGYDYTAPNPPWDLRDVMNKCDCGKVWVGISSAVCIECAQKQANIQSTDSRGAYVSA